MLPLKKNSFSDHPLLITCVEFRWWVLDIFFSSKFSGHCCLWGSNVFGLECTSPDTTMYKPWRTNKILGYTRSPPELSLKTMVIILPRHCVLYSLLFNYISNSESEVGCVGVVNMRDTGRWDQRDSNLGQVRRRRYCNFSSCNQARQGGL